MRNAFITGSAVFALAAASAVYALAPSGEQAETTVPATTSSTVAEAATAQDSSQLYQEVDAKRITLGDASRLKAENAKLLPKGVKSLLKTSGTLTHGDYVWNDEGVPAGKITVFVDIRRQMMSVFKGGHEIGTAVIVYGAGDHESPLGTFPILSKYRDYHSRTYDAPMPHSLFLTRDGVAIHGNVMETYRATKGCIGLPPEFAQLLFDVASKGDIVEITQSQAPAEKA